MTRLLAKLTLVALAATAATPVPALSTIFPVAAGSSIQSAIDAAGDGDVVSLAAGTYHENIDFSGKAVVVVGSGPDTVIRGSAGAPVVTFASGETAESVLDSVTITGGSTGFGGGIHVSGASPTIVRNVITQNRAIFQGSGVYVENGSPLLANNLIIYNSNAGGDPHGIEVVDASPTIVNNTIARGDSNGIILRGFSPALVMNNVIAYNGSRVDRASRGRGICDFSGGLASIHYNDFFRNRVAALLTNGRDFGRIDRAEREIGAPRLVGNVSGKPGFVRRIHRKPERTELDDFRLNLARRRVRARDAGNPDPIYDDVDGTRNDLGASGGPLAPAWLR